MTRIHATESDLHSDEREFLGLGVALDAVYRALGRRATQVPNTASVQEGTRKCPECEITAGFNTSPNSVCDIAGRLLSQFMAGVRCNEGYRRDYQGFRELDGISLFWDNASIRRDVDDYEVVPGAFDLDLRFPLFLASDEIARLEESLSARLRPAFMEAQREQSQEGEGTHLQVSVYFLNGP